MLLVSWATGERLSATKRTAGGLLTGRALITANRLLAVSLLTMLAKCMRSSSWSRWRWRVNARWQCFKLVFLSHRCVAAVGSVPKVSLCAGGKYQRASDPWVTFGADGTAYFMSLAFNEDL